MLIELVKANPGDHIAILNLIRISFDEYRSLYTNQAYSEVICSKKAIVKRFSEGPVYKAIEGSKILGTMSMVINEDHIYIRGMAVDPKVRNKSIGWNLLSKAEKISLNSGKKQLILHTTPFLDKAINLYSKFGFRQIDETPKPELLGTLLIKMVKNL